MSLAVWVIYDHPVDHPEHYVLRRQDVIDGQVVPSKDCVLFTSLEGARAWCQNLGLTNVGRMAADEPQIAEVWL